MRERLIQAAWPPFPPRTTREWLLRFRATILICAAILVAGVYSATISAAAHARLERRFGMDLDVVRHGQLWTLPVSTFVQSEPGLKWHMALFVLSSLLILETLAGSARAAAAFLLADWISSPLTIVILRIASGLGGRTAERYLHVAETGSSASFHGAFAAAAALLPGRWPLLPLSVMAAVAAAAFTFQRPDNAVAHALATAVGLASGLWFRRGRRRNAPKSPSA